MQDQRPLKLYFLAGEPSGDLHGKNLIAELLQMRPNLEMRGMGGDGMEALGVKLVRHIRHTSFMGWAEVIKNLGTIKQLFRDVKADILDFQPDAVVMIDYPGFNIRMAEWLKGEGIKVLYYISPQVWAWKKGRVKKIRAYVDRMFTILPFEKAFYANEGVEVEYVGHPLLDEIAHYQPKNEDLRAQLKPNGEKLLLLLPGSRKMEISRMLPVMLQAAQRFPHLKVAIAGAPTQEPEYYAQFMQGHTVPVVHGRTYDLLSLADYGFVCSGTATLETALFGVPEVVCYASNWLSVQLARLLIKVDFISLVNLIMGRETVKELIQKDLTPKTLERELKKLMEPQHAAKLAADYQSLQQLLGNAGASRKCAEGILGVLSN